MAETSTSPRSALIVDDNQLNSKLVSVFLARLGWQVRTASSGADALQSLRDHAVDLVLLDLRMPAMSGEQVCAAIRKDLGLADLPVVAYTAHGMPEERDRMIAAGFTELLVKPISFQDVRDMCRLTGFDDA